MIEKNEYCSDMMKIHFNKELVMTRERDEDFENSTNCWICYNYQIDNDVKARGMVISPENVEVLRIEIVISMLN